MAPSSLTVRINTTGVFTCRVPVSGSIVWEINGASIQTTFGFEPDIDVITRTVGDVLVSDLSIRPLSVALDGAEISCTNTQPNKFTQSAILFVTGGLCAVNMHPVFIAY